MRVCVRVCLAPEFAGLYIVSFFARARMRVYMCPATWSTPRPRLQSSGSDVALPCSLAFEWTTQSRWSYVLLTALRCTSHAPDSFCCCRITPQPRTGHIPFQLSRPSRDAEPVERARSDLAPRIRVYPVRSATDEEPRAPPQMMCEWRAVLHCSLRYSVTAGMPRLRHRSIQPLWPDSLVACGGTASLACESCSVFRSLNILIIATRPGSGPI